MTEPQSMAMLWLALLVAVAQNTVAAPQKVKRQEDQVTLDLNWKQIILFLIQEQPRCIDYIGNGFFCLPSYQCNDDFVIATDAVGLFDVRYVICVIISWN